MSLIFKEYKNRFFSANWDRISSAIIEKNGIYIEVGTPGQILNGGEYFENMWSHQNTIDESGLDERGVDHNDITEKILKSNKNEKRGTKRL